MRRPSNHAPSAVRRALHTVGEHLRAARLRRRISTAVLAERALVSRATLYRVERGDPAVSMGTYATVLWAVGLGDRLSDLAAPSRDHHWAGA